MNPWASPWGVQRSRRPFHVFRRPCACGGSTSPPGRLGCPRTAASVRAGSPARPGPPKRREGATRGLSKVSKGHQLRGRLGGAGSGKDATPCVAAHVEATACVSKGGRPYSSPRELWDSSREISWGKTNRLVLRPRHRWFGSSAVRPYGDLEHPVRPYGDLEHPVRPYGDLEQPIASAAWLRRWLHATLV